MRRAALFPSAGSCLTAPEENSDCGNETLSLVGDRSAHPRHHLLDLLGFETPCPPFLLFHLFHIHPPLLTLPEWAPGGASFVTHSNKE